MSEGNFMRVEDVAKELGVSKSYAQLVVLEVHAIEKSVESSALSHLDGR